MELLVYNLIGVDPLLVSLELGIVVGGFSRLLYIFLNRHIAVDSRFCQLALRLEELLLGIGHRFILVCLHHLLIAAGIDSLDNTAGDFNRSTVFHEFHNGILQQRRGSQVGIIHFLDFCGMIRGLEQINNHAVVVQILDAVGKQLDLILTQALRLDIPKEICLRFIIIIFNVLHRTDQTVILTQVRIIVGQQGIERQICGRFCHGLGQLHTSQIHKNAGNRNTGNQNQNQKD